MSSYPTGPDDRPDERPEITEEDLMSTDRTSIDDEPTGSAYDTAGTDRTAGPGTDAQPGEHPGTLPTWASPSPQEAPVLRGPALGTLLWGFVVLAVAGLVGAWELADVRVDLSLVLPVGMVAVGALLVLGALVTALRGRS